jgi:hypothetical protein
MKIVETKSYEFRLTSAERKQLSDTAEFLRSIEIEIDRVIGDEHPILVESDDYTGNDLWRAAELLDGIALGGYDIE